jgi:putative DNA primase/helicase
VGTDIKQKAVGRWREILLSLGMPSSALGGKHGPCPICDEGKDRFRFDNLEGKGSWICSKCGAGYGVDLVMRWKRVEFVDAVKLIESVIDTARVEAPRARVSSDVASRENAALWERGRFLNGRDLASRYLENRGIKFDKYPACLRFVADCVYSDGPGSQATREPAMLAKIVAADGSRALVHRTYLQEPGMKADVPEKKKLMFGKFPDGGAVRLAPAEKTMGIAEGIESALSVAQKHGMPVWAATNAVMLTKWMPPLEAENIVIFGDYDCSYAGQAASYSLAYRLRSLSRIKTVTVQFTAHKDEGVGAPDWNDLILAEIGKEAILCPSGIDNRYESL